MKGKLDRIVLRPTRIGSALLLFVSAGFTIGGVWMVASDAAKGWFVTLFFGLCTLVALVNALPNASFLVLDAEGMEFCSLFRRHRVAWSEIASFGVAMLGVNETVVFTFSAARLTAHPPSRWRLPGIDGALPATYGQTAGDLASLLDDWRNGVRRAPPAPSAPRLAMALGRSLRGPFGLLLLKLLALFSFCGGPLRVTDALKRYLPQPYAFALAFSPLVLLLFGAFALRDGARDVLDRWSIAGGRFGSVLLLAMNAYSSWLLLRGDSSADRGLVAFGTVVGVLTALLYFRLAAFGGDRRPPTLLALEDQRPPAEVGATTSGRTERDRAAEPR